MSSRSFIFSLYAILEDEAYHSAIAWAEDGLSFVLRSHSELESRVLPCHFKHSNVSSFVRQLNFYSFIKYSASDSSDTKGEDALSNNSSIDSSGELPKGDVVCFKHKYFRKGRPDLLVRLIRKTNANAMKELLAEELREKIQVQTEAKIMNLLQDSCDNLSDSPLQENFCPPLPGPNATFTSFLISHNFSEKLANILGLISSFPRWNDLETYTVISDPSSLSEHSFSEVTYSRSERLSKAVLPPGPMPMAGYVAGLPTITELSSLIKTAEKLLKESDVSQLSELLAILNDFLQLHKYGLNISLEDEHSQLLTNVKTRRGLNEVSSDSKPIDASSTSANSDISSSSPSLSSSTSLKTTRVSKVRLPAGQGGVGRPPKREAATYRINNPKRRRSNSIDERNNYSRSSESVVQGPIQSSFQSRRVNEGIQNFRVPHPLQVMDSLPSAHPNPMYNVPYNGATFAPGFSTGTLFAYPMGMAPGSFGTVDQDPHFKQEDQVSAMFSPMNQNDSTGKFFNSQFQSSLMVQSVNQSAMYLSSNSIGAPGSPISPLYASRMQSASTHTAPPSPISTHNVSSITNAQASASVAEASAQSLYPPFPSDGVLHVGHYPMFNYFNHLVSNPGLDLQNMYSNFGRSLHLTNSGEINSLTSKETATSTANVPSGNMTVPSGPFNISEKNPYFRPISHHPSEDMSSQVPVLSAHPFDLHNVSFPIGIHGNGIQMCAPSLDPRRSTTFDNSHLICPSITTADHPVPVLATSSYNTSTTHQRIEQNSLNMSKSLLPNSFPTLKGTSTLMPTDVSSGIYQHSPTALTRRLADISAGSSMESSNIRFSQFDGGAGALPIPVGFHSYDVRNQGTDQVLGALPSALSQTHNGYQYVKMTNCMSDNHETGNPESNTDTTIA